LTRSGSRLLHGTAYDYLRNGVFDARDWFTQFNETTDERNIGFHQQDFGATLGGPFAVPHFYQGQDKTFFFGSYEALHVTNPSAPLVQYVPGVSTRTDVPDALKAIVNAFPTPATGSLSDPGLSPFVYGVLFLPSHVGAGSIRLDHTFRPGATVFGRYSNTRSDSQTQDLSSISTSRLDSQTVTVGATVAFSPRISNDFRLGYAHSAGSLRAAVDRQFFNQPTNLNQDFGIPGNLGSGGAEIYIRIPGVGESAIHTDVTDNALDHWSVRDTLLFQPGHHLFRAGIDERRIHTSIRPAAISVFAAYVSRDALLQNRASDLVLTKRGPADPLINEFAAFVQDDWKLSTRVNLSAGVRWEVNPSPGEAHGKLAYAVRGDIQDPRSLEVAPRGSPLWKTNWFNIAPRVGIAWQVKNTPARELILRSGVGLYFDNADQAAAGAYSAFGFSSSVQLPGSSLPVKTSQFEFQSGLQAPSSTSAAYLFSSHLQAPYFVHWNLSLERALGTNQAFTVSYVGAAGRRLLLPQRTDVGQQNHDFSEIYYFPSGITSSYQSGQVRFQRSISSGLQVLLSYAWSHALDYGSTSPSYRLTHGNSDTDVRHSMQAAASWDIPQFSCGPVRKGLCKGWGLDGRLLTRSSYPITLLGNLMFDPVTGEPYYSGVDQVARRPTYLRGSQYPGGRVINAGPALNSPAFVLPGVGSSGSAPRNDLRGFSATQLNIALRKEIPIAHRLDLQFRAETFNLLNHPDLGYIDAHITDALSGQSTLMLNQSFGSNGSLYQQGGPRSIQFSLKLQF